MDSPVTTIQIARRVGTSQSTVSRALRNDPRVSAKTRRRIQAEAKKMGYRPDPALSALIAYRNKMRAPSEYGKIAVLHDWNRELSHFPIGMRQIVEGIREQAAQYGYAIELFHVTQDKAQNRMLSRVLYNRGIRGLIVTPVRIPKLFLNWELFSCVSVGENLASPQLNQIVQDHDWFLRSTYRQLRRLGYRKIGFCNDLNCEVRQQEKYIGAYLRCLYSDGLPFEESVPLLYDENTDWSPIPWLERYRFDAVVVVAPHIFLRPLEGSPYRVPRNLGVAGIAMPNPSEDNTIAGYTIDYRSFGSVAVDLLQTSLIHGIRGIPSESRYRHICLHGHWRMGSTVRRMLPVRITPGASKRTKESQAR